MQKSHRLIVLLVMALLLPSVFTNTVVTAQDTGGATIPRLNGGGMGGGSNPQPNYNPFSPNKLSGTEDLVYEKLFVMNNYSCEQVPWLATEYTWVDPQTLTFTLRDGVAWSDGTPFTGDDVAYTFTTLKANKALDLNGATVGLNTVTAEGNTVTFSFDGPAIPQWNKIVRTMIVPKHIFEPQTDLTTFINDNPVGTGPYSLGSMNSEELIWQLRPDYWGETIQVQEIRYTKPAEGQANMLRLAQGEYDWDMMYIPNIEQVYVSQDPEHNKYWFAQGSSISIYFNLTKEPFNDVAFRKAVALAVDKDEIVEKAQLGYVTKASQTGLKLPGQADWLNPEIPNEGYIDRNVEEAKKVLTDAGYTYDGDRLLTPAGAPVEFRFQTPAGWNDWIAAADIVKNSLAEIGITMNVETPDFTVVDNDRKTGNFDATFGVHGGDCSMFQNFNDPFGSAMSAPVGESAVTNWVRWMDPETDALLEQFLAAETEDQQKQIVNQLQAIVYNEFPSIPLWYGALWFEYRTENAVGWPNADDPYANANDMPLVLPRLTAP